MGADELLLGFAEKGDESESGPGWINAGVYAITRALIQTVPSHRSVSLEREMFPAWIGQGLYGYRSNGRFIDIGTPDAYGLAKHFFLHDIPS